eukprot:3261935-Prymnesium_polylepis.1
MHRDVPQPPVLLEVVGVPPRLVKLAVAEAQDLGEQIEPAVEEGVEAGEPDVGDGKRELEEALHDDERVASAHGSTRVLQQWQHVLGDERGDGDGDDGEPRDEGEQVGPPHVRRAREGHLVAKRRRDGKVGHRGEADVVRVVDGAAAVRVGDGGRVLCEA